MWPRPISQPHCKEHKTRWEGELKSTKRLHPTAADSGKLVPIERDKIPMGLSPKSSAHSSAEGHRGAMTEGNFSRLDWELNQSFVDSSPALDPDAQGSPFLYTIPAVYGLIILIGLVGNVTLIKIFCTVKSMRNVPNIFITSLALGDLLLLLTCAPVDASKYVSTEWIFGRVGCKLIPFIQLTSVGVSVFTLTALSADRYKAIVRPMDIQTTNALMKICVKAALIWVFSMLLAVPDAVFSDLQSFYESHSNKTFTTCAPYPLGDELHPKIHSTASFLILYVIPLFIISVYYFHIAKNLIRSAYNIPAEGNQHILRQMESRKRLAKTVLVFVGFFAVSWLPSHIIYLYRSYHYMQVDTSLAHLVGSICARILAFSNSCVNPFALYLLSKTFRKQFNNNLFCCRSHLLSRSASTGRSTTASRMTSLKSTNHSVASFSLINGNFVQQEGYV